MKHYFIVNPCAGIEDHTLAIREQLDSLGDSVDWEMHVTQRAGEATEYVAKRCKETHDETLRFYACGGDGTLNEVLTGMIGCNNVELAAYPCGSGNDYIKYYGSADDFLDIKRLIDGEARAVDVMQVGKHYSLNICNFGFDALVCKTMDKVRRWPLLGGKNAYTTGIVRHILTGRRTQVSILVDGELFYEGRILLCTLANGRYVGGKYKCAPFSDNRDGLMEINLIRPMSLARFAGLIDSYSDGTYVSQPGIEKVHKYCRGRNVAIDSPKPVYLCVDGEVLCDNHFEVKMLPQAVRFVVPNTDKQLIG